MSPGDWGTQAQDLGGPPTRGCGQVGEQEVRGGKSGSQLARQPQVPRWSAVPRIEEQPHSCEGKGWQELADSVPDLVPGFPGWL